MNREFVATKVAAKLHQVAQGQRPRILDLFSGCGGISLGFQAAGFEISGSVELDPVAAHSHARNFHHELGTQTFDRHSRPRDIIDTEPNDLLREFGLGGDVGEGIDVVVGGPPCQAFARVGRAKLREVAEHPEAFLRDPRGNLYLRYVEYVRRLAPVAILMENVPDVLNYGGHNIAEEIAEVLDDLGYDVRYTLLNAVYFGVPEMRERMFLVAYHRLLGATQWFPDPTHWTELPSGYEGTRQVALKTIQNNLFVETKYYFDPPKGSKTTCRPAVTAEDALSDLPVIPSDSPQKQSKGPRRFDVEVSYGLPPQNSFQMAMREWPGFASRGYINDHVIRYLPRDYRLFAQMQSGDQYPEAYKLATRLFEERLDEIARLEGVRPSAVSSRYEYEKALIVPPYDASKFPNKWRKMEPNRPARTLMAHLGKDSYSHIHYDSSQARTISVREAARLQSFPDGFVFSGTMNPAFRQIGNAVPPLLARAIAQIVFEQIERGAHDGTKDSLETAHGVGSHAFQ